MLLPQQILDKGKALDNTLRIQLSRQPGKLAILPRVHVVNRDYGEMLPTPLSRDYKHTEFLFSALLQNEVWAYKQLQDPLVG